MYKAATHVLLSCWSWKSWQTSSSTAREKFVNLSCSLKKCFSYSSIVHARHVLPPSLPPYLPHSLSHSLTHSLALSLTHSLIPSLPPSPLPSYLSITDHSVAQASTFPRLAKPTTTTAPSSAQSLTAVSSSPSTKVRSLSTHRTTDCIGEWERATLVSNSEHICETDQCRKILSRCTCF